VTLFNKVGEVNGYAKKQYLLNPKKKISKAPRQPGKKFYLCNVVINYNGASPISANSSSSLGHKKNS